MGTKEILKSIDKRTLSEAVEVLCEALREDKSEGSYYFSWQANIAVAFQDEWKRQHESAASIGVKIRDPNSRIHEMSNNAAKNFLDLLIRDAKNDYPDD